MPSCVRSAPERHWLCLGWRLERLMQQIAVILRLDSLEVIRRNLVDHCPHRCPAGAMLDSGNDRAGIEHAIEAGDSPRCATAARRRAPKAVSTASAMPRWSNPRSPTWAITTVLTAAERRAAGRKGWRFGGRHRVARPARQRLVRHRFTAAGTGAPHGYCASCERCFRPEPGFDPGRHGARYRQRRVIDRRQQLFEPLRRGGRRRCAPRGAAPGRQTCRYCRGATEPAARRSAVW